jgi:Na+-translocating ferredoxin:NAD+ oxidoreductase RnfE subunit
MISFMAKRIDMDRVGAIASAACAVHCVLTGLALGLMSVTGLGFIGSPIVEAGFFLTAILVGTWALVHGVRKHHSFRPALVFILGMGSLLVSHFILDHDSIAGSLTSAFGGVCLVTFHILNQKMGHSCTTCTCP